MRSILFRLNRRGATLPLTIIVLALMAVGVAVTFGRISAERAIGSDTKARLGAFAVAQSGLNRYLASLSAKPAAPVSWATWPNSVLATVNYTDLPGGTATVNLIQLRDSTTNLLPAVYVITSRGRYTAAKRWNSRVPVAERTVATYAVWTPAPFQMKGAITTLGPIAYNGNSATISGIDRCGIQPNTAGIATPAPAGNPTSPTGDLSLFNQQPPTYIDGTPDNAAASMGAPYPATGSGSARDNLQMDWAGIKAGTAFPADLTYSGTWPPMNGGAGLGMEDWPVIRVNNEGGADFTLPGSGKGILIVTGNMRWNGTPLKTWEGIILIGGSLVHNGAGNVYGGVVTNMNVKTGSAPLNSDIGNGTKTYWYDSCAISRAMGKIGSIQRIRNGWTDTWSSY
jgi:hypothetical protein